MVEKIKNILNAGMSATIRFKTLFLLFHNQNVRIKIYRNMILFSVLYGCETWCLTIREGRRLRVFENRMLREIFGLKRED